MFHLPIIVQHTGCLPTNHSNQSQCVATQTTPQKCGEASSVATITERELSCDKSCNFSESMVETLSSLPVQDNRVLVSRMFTVNNYWLKYMQLMN